MGARLWLPIIPPHHPRARSSSSRTRGALQALYAGDEKLLKELESELGVRVVARDSGCASRAIPARSSACASSSPNSTKPAKRGLAIRRHEFEYSPAQRRRRREKEPLAPARSQDHLLAAQAARRPENRRPEAYVEMIRSHDITLGVGPAGTGKTYLAVALASPRSSRGKGQPHHSHPSGGRGGEALGFLPGDLQEKLLPYLVPASTTRSTT